MSPAYFLISPGIDVIDTNQSTTTNKNTRNGSIIGIIGMIVLIIILLCALFIFGIWWKRNKHPRRYNKVEHSDFVNLERKTLANNKNNSDLFNKDSYGNFYSQQQQQQHNQYNYNKNNKDSYGNFTPNSNNNKNNQYNNNINTTTTTTNNNNNNNNSNSNTNISSTPSFPIITSPSPTIKRDKIRNTDTWERYLKMINNPIRLNSVVNSKKYYGS